MDEEQKEWHQIYSASIGASEFLRFGCFFLFWIFSGVALAITFNNFAILVIFFITLFIFAIVAPRWRPAYFLLRKIVGNENLPTEPMPRTTTKRPRQPLPWYGYLPSIWGWLMFLLLLYIILKR